MKEIMETRRDKECTSRSLKDALQPSRRYVGWQRRMLRLMKSYTFTILMLVLALALSGCQVPKNVAPCADATGALHRAINESGAVTAEAMATVPSVLSGTSARKEAKEFIELWQDRVKLMDVLLGYSDALAGVAAASTAAQQTVEALGSSITQLAAVVPVTGSAVAAGVQLGQVLIRTGIEIKAFHDLAQAVNAAHPALAEVAKYLEADLEDLRRLYLKASQDLEAALDDQYGERESQRNKLQEKRNQLRNTMITNFHDATIEQVMLVEELLAHMEPEHQEYTRQRNAVLLRRTTTLQMFKKASKGVRAWVRAHEELKVALEQNRQPNVRLILATAQELKDAVDRIRNP